MNQNDGNQIDSDAASSTGQLQTEGNYLDKHFICMQEEYEATLLAAEIQSGWKILDAGAGGGSFLPLMSKLVGNTGHIDAIDLAPENVQMIQNRANSGEYAAPVVAREASLFELPFKDNSFDLIWCANVTQYLTDDELQTALNEMDRVLKPGGWLAIKEVDLDGYRAVAPLDPLLFRRLIALATDFTQIAGVLRTTLLPSWLRKLSYDSIKTNAFHCALSHPLTEKTKPYAEIAIETWGNIGTTLEVSDDDKKHWQRLLKSNGEDYILNDPDFYYREAWMLVRGQKPKD